MKRIYLNDILSKLDLTNCDVKSLSLICSRDELVKRLKKDIKAGVRQEDVIARSIERLPLYAALNTVKVDVSDLSVEIAAEALYCEPCRIAKMLMPDEVQAMTGYAAILFLTERV